jgi:hypothetical protein
MTITIIYRSYCTFNKDLCVSCFIRKGNSMRGQLENYRVLKTYFLSSLVEYSAKLACVVIVPQNILSKVQFRICEMSPLETEGICPTREMRFKITFKMQKYCSHCHLILKGVVSTPLLMAHETLFGTVFRF